MADIEPPKPRKNLGRKRGVKQAPRVLSVESKARASAKRVIKKQDDKIKKATNDLHNAKKRKERILKTSIKKYKSSIQDKTKNAETT